MIVGPDVGEAGDLANDVGVDDEVLAEITARREAVLAQQCPDVVARVHALPADADRNGRVGEVADRHEDVGVQHDVDPGGQRRAEAVDARRALAVVGVGHRQVRPPRRQRGGARLLGAVVVPPEAGFASGLGRGRRPAG